MAESCEPYCGFLDSPQSDDEVPICDVCGAGWMLREVTEVDPATGLPTVTQRGWTRV